MPLKLHAEPLHHTRRCYVLGDTLRPDTVQTQLTETKVQQGPRRLGSIPIAPVVVIQLITNIGLTRISRLHPNAAISNQLSRTFQGNHKLKLASRSLLLPEHKSLHEITYIRLRSL